MKLFIADLKKIIKSPESFLALKNTLNPNDQSRFDCFSNQRRAIQFLASRILIKNHISSEYQTLESGKIVIKNGFVSVAHTQNFIVVSFDDAPVGVDIEKITSRRDYKRIAKRMKFKNVNTPYDFFKSWTTFEADFKLGATSKRKTHLFVDHQGFLICVSSLGQKPLEIEFVKI